MKNIQIVVQIYCENVCGSNCWFTICSSIVKIPGTPRRNLWWWWFEATLNFWSLTAVVTSVEVYFKNTWLLRMAAFRFQCHCRLLGDSFWAAFVLELLDWSKLQCKSTEAVNKLTASSVIMFIRCSSHRMLLLRAKVVCNDLENIFKISALCVGSTKKNF